MTKSNNFLNNYFFYFLFFIFFVVGITIFKDYGISVDEDSLDQVLEKHDNIGCLVFPGVKEGIDWEMFSEKVKNDSDEPCTQMGLNFDTDVGKKIS